MIRKFYYTGILLFSLMSSQLLRGQAFHKGALLLSISEGSTSATYSTSNVRNSPTAVLHFSKQMDGIRDPLFIEYGLSNRWGIGLSQGNDLFTVNAHDYYGYHTAGDKPLDVKTSELTLDLNYHFLVRKRIDWCIYGSAGLFGVSYLDNTPAFDGTNNYKAKGGITRVGSKLRYYFWKRLGVLVMVSAYSGNANPLQSPGFTENQGYSTKISGTATEFGLCFRFF
jgi:hypothetical protein